jgi:hypothetical protein
MSDRRKSIRLYDLVKDEKGALSSARCGMWATLCFMFGYVIWTPEPSVAVLSSLTTVLVMFGGWAAGSKFATAWGSLGAVAQGVASSSTGSFVPHTWSRGDPDAGVL